MSTAAIGRPGLSAEAVDTLARMARAGYTDVEIGQHLGVSTAAVGRKRRALGIEAGVSARLRVVVARRALSTAVENYSHDTRYTGLCTNRPKRRTP